MYFTDGVRPDQKGGLVHRRPSAVIIGVITALAMLLLAACTGSAEADEVTVGSWVKWDGGELRLSEITTTHTIGGEFRDGWSTNPGFKFLVVKVSFEKDKNAEMLEISTIDAKLKVNDRVPVVSDGGGRPGGACVNCSGVFTAPAENLDYSFVFVIDEDAREQDLKFRYLDSPWIPLGGSAT